MSVTSGRKDDDAWYQHFLCRKGAAHTNWCPCRKIDHFFTAAPHALFKPMIHMMVVLLLPTFRILQSRSYHAESFIRGNNKGEERRTIHCHQGLQIRKEKYCNCRKEDTTSRLLIMPLFW
mmetsp:Transcript_24099/g.67902  ORF Transcript_24099/g.67902 Transcript_24099/m.67902 type:complete len:120 (+) Transcript_24099:91-450(+)